MHSSSPLQSIVGMCVLLPPNILGFVKCENRGNFDIQTTTCTQTLLKGFLPGTLLRYDKSIGETYVVTKFEDLFHYPVTIPLKKKEKKNWLCFV